MNGGQAGVRPAGQLWCEFKRLGTVGSDNKGKERIDVEPMKKNSNVGNLEKDVN